MNVPVLTGDKTWIDVLWRDQGFFLRFRKAECGTLSWPKRSRGWDESVAGTGTRVEREGYKKGLEQGVLEKKWRAEGGWGVEEVTGKWIWRGEGGLTGVGEKHVCVGDLQAEASVREKWDC